MKTNIPGIDLIKQFEGLVDGDPNTPGLDPYICPTGYVTIGYGRVLKDASGKNPLKGRTGLATAKKLYPAIDAAKAEEYLKEDLARFEAAVQRLTSGVKLNENQFSALVSLTFNIGEGAFAKSTLLAKLREGDYAAAADQFAVWNKGTVNGKKVPINGLIRRREAERQLFITEVKPLIQSRTIIASTTAAVATASTLATDIAEQLTSAQAQVVSITGSSFASIQTALLVLAVAGACFAIYARINDRLTKGR